MTEPIKPATSEIRALCDHSDRLIEAYLDCLGNNRCKRRGIGRYESEVEYYTMLKLMIRHLESIVALARNDMVLAPSAHVISRTLLETSIRARWMFVPIDPYEREVRWLLMLRAGVHHANRVSNNQYAPEALARIYNARHASYKSFADSIANLLKDRGYRIPKQIPNVADMLNDLNEPHTYRFYMQLSEYSHSNYEASGLYRRHMGDAKEYGEFTGVFDWILPFSVAWKSFFLAAHGFVSLVEADIESFEYHADVKMFDGLIVKAIEAEPLPYGSPDAGSPPGEA